MEAYLIEGIQQNNEQVFSEIYHRYHAKLYYYFLSKTQISDVCADLVQTTFIKCWNYRHYFTTDISLSQQIFRIAKTTLIDLLRKKAKERLVRLEECTSIVNIPETSLPVLNRLEEVTATLYQIPPERRRIVKFRLDGLTNKEIAEHLGISIKTVENQINKAIKEIRAQVSSASNVPLALMLVCLLHENSVITTLHSYIN
ncbi:MAG TPA: sigma-70 family RNA polymerase sigma factor [Flavisolibacter sp.]|nr:sigma-70 family RNA polymerase sigma factor [Flavisolibacter sp.]